MTRLSPADVVAAVERAADALEASRDRLTELDQAVGDGDLGITAGKLAAALREFSSSADASDIGAYLAQAGMAMNRAASSSLGTLLATATMRAGKAVRGKSELALADVAAMVEAADVGLQERGKAKPGDKTIIDVVHPAAEAARASVEAEEDAGETKERILIASREGRDAVTPLRSRVGRASWIGERTEGAVDPGCEAGVIIVEAIVGPARRDV